MADPNWRSPTPPSGRSSPAAASEEQQRYQGVPTNGLHGAGRIQFPASNGQVQHKFHSSAGGAGSAPHTSPGGAFSPATQPILTAHGMPSPLSSSSARGGPGTTRAAGPGRPAQGQSPFSTGSARMGPPRAGSPPVAFGSGPRTYATAPLSAGSGMRIGAPPKSSSDPVSMSMSRGSSPAPTHNAFAKAQPPFSGPPAGPPPSWPVNGNGTAASGHRSGQAYITPPSLPPPPVHPVSRNGVAHDGGRFSAGPSGPGAMPTPSSVYSAPRSGPPTMPAPGQYQHGYSNGGMPAPAVSPRPKIDPQQIPRPIVSSESTAYRTCTPPSIRVPPPPTSNYVAIDEGNCSPRFMRSTIAQLPTTADAMGACKIPMAVVIQPMAIVGPKEAAVNLVDFGESGPLRCESCRAYINSFAKYVQNGEKWVCNFCNHEGAVPQSYQCPLDAAGLRRDREQRPELSRGSVDFVVPKAVYCLRPEQQPIFVFIIDASPRALETGFTTACLSAVEASLDAVPGGERARVGIMTFDGRLQVYKFDDEGNVSQMVVAADTEEPFAPLPPAQWILPLHSCKRGLPKLLRDIPGLIEGDRRHVSPATACASGAALRATADCLDGIGGRVFLFAQSPPDAGAGKVSRGREEAGLYGGDKEFRLYQPAGDTGKDVAAVAAGVFYKALAKDCAARQVCVDLMLWSGLDVREFYDTGTIGMVSKVTGGRVTYLRGRDAGGADTLSHLREQLAGALRNHADSASEAVLKVRCTAGLACTQRLGPGVENMPGELEVATVTPHHTIVGRLEHDGRKLQEGGMIYIQAALLYTSTSGQRRVRCHTLGLPATGVLANIFRSVDVETVSAVMARQAVSRALSNKVAVQAVLTQMEESMLAMLFSYRKRCAPNSPAGQLILPEALRVLPLYTLCTRKMLALRANAQGAAPDVRADERAARLLAAHSMSISDMVQVLYPSLYSMHDLPPDVGDLPPPSPPPAVESPEGEASNGTAAARGVEGVWGRPRVGVDIPAALPPTSEKLSSEGVFLLDSGEELLMYVGRLVNAEVMLELFGVDAAVARPSTSGYDTGGASLRLREEEGYEQARRVRNVIEHLRRGCTAYKPLVIVVANSGVPEEARFVSLMVEDKTKQGTSYVDELCHLHQKIQSRMR